LVFFFFLKRVFTLEPVSKEKIASIAALRCGEGVAVLTGFTDRLPEEICAPFFIENKETRNKTIRPEKRA